MTAISYLNDFKLKSAEKGAAVLVRLRIPILCLHTYPFLQLTNLKMGLSKLDELYRGLVGAATPAGTHYTVQALISPDLVGKILMFR